MNDCSHSDLLYVAITWIPTMKLALSLLVDAGMHVSRLLNRIMALLVVVYSTSDDQYTEFTSAANRRTCEMNFHAQNPKHFLGAKRWWC